MSSSITIESPSISIPCPSKPKNPTQHGFPGSGVSLEMYNMPERNAISRDSISRTQNLESLPPSNHESTRSSPPGPMVDQMQTIWEPYKNRFRVLATSLTALSNGMNDSANGALIGSIEKYPYPSLVFMFTNSLAGTTISIMALFQPSFFATLWASSWRRSSSAQCPRGLGEPKL